MNIKSDWIALTKEQRVAVRRVLGIHLAGDNDAEFLLNNELLQKKLGKEGTHEELYLEAKVKGRLGTSTDSTVVPEPKKKSKKVK